MAAIEPRPQAPSTPQAKGKPEMPPRDVQAKIIGDFLMPAAFAGMLGQSTLTAGGVQCFVEEFTRAAVQTKDPLERVLVEQILIAHHRVIQLHAQAAGQKDPVALAIYNAAAARLSSELRRLIETLKKYRAPAQSRSTVVHTVQHISQQNVVADGRQDIAFVDRGEGGSRLDCREGKLEAKEQKYDGNDRFREQGQFQASGRRTAEPAQAGTVD